MSQDSGLAFPSQLHGSGEERQAHTGAEAKESPHVDLGYRCTTELPLFIVLLVGLLFLPELF